MRTPLLFVFATFAATVTAQTWEAGGVIGGSLSKDAGVSNTFGQATAGLAGGPAFGALFGQTIHRFVDGEIRYTAYVGDLRVRSGAAQAGFRAQTHAIHYDILVHARPAGAPLRPFVAIGAGGRIFRGTGTESEYQPGQEYVLLTKTREWKPMASVGGGVKIAVSPRVLLRLEFRDYISPFPKQVIAPADGSKITGWLHSFVPLAGISLLF